MELSGIPRGRRSRRSSLNLNLSAISPLSTNILDDSNRKDVDNDGVETDGLEFRSSYLQTVSTPSTPSILSRASSRHNRKGSRHRQHQSFAALPLTGITNQSFTNSSNLTKSKSSSYLVYEDRHRGTTYRTRSRIDGEDDSEWLHRAGIALSSGTRESKGQSWLLSRASSTSLVDAGDESSDGEPQKVKRQSYQDLRRSNNSSSTTLRRASLPANLAQYEPEFIDDSLLVDEFDEEDLHWSKQHKSGLGVWMDRLMGWTLFSMREEDDESDEEEERRKENYVLENGRRRRMIPVQFPKPEEAHVEDEVKVKERTEEEGWQDAAWIFAIVTKVLL